MVHRCANAPYDFHPLGCRLSGIDDWYNNSGRINSHAVLAAGEMETQKLDPEQSAYSPEA